MSTKPRIVFKVLVGIACAWALTLGTRGRGRVQARKEHARRRLGAAGGSAPLVPG